MSRDDKLACFGCHATHAREGGELTLDKMMPGVQCAHCHRSTEAHLAGMARGSNKPAVPAGLTDLEDLSAEQTSNFYGQCHRTWAEIAMQAGQASRTFVFNPTG